jgi:hypothetical protein
MAGDEDSDDGPPPRPSPPRRRREGLVIEGEPILSNARVLRDAPPALRDLVAAALGGAVGAALTLAGVYGSTRSPDFAPLARRTEVLEAAVETAAEERRDLGARLAAAQKAADGFASLKDDLARASEERRALATRLVAVERALAAAREQAAGTQARLDALESASPAASAPPVVASAAAVSALRRRLAAGEPLGGELAALERLGVEPAALSPLRRFAASGAPTLASLAAALNGLAGAGGAGATPGGLAARLWGELRGLVKSRKVGESREAEAEAFARARAALDRGDLAGALAELRKSPPPAQEAAQSWMEAAQARLTADDAVEALAREAAADFGAARR